MIIIIDIGEDEKPVGTYRDSLLDVSCGEVINNKQIVEFLDLKYLNELYDRYKEEITWDIYGLQDEKDIKEKMITIEEFLGSEYIYILLGCYDGEGHEVLCS